ncbi:chorion peroxidase-like [Microplitis mediator]|uniref:chorion peroxidase-like n=1 Tax=Microplitis mediator TaxID=375433 RepID=UPI0025530E9A|nr:chorion peroxidase-like [Microplitis mediator]
MHFNLYAYFLSNILLSTSQTLQVSNEVKPSLQNYRSNNLSNFQVYDENITFIKSKTLEEAEDFGLQAMNSLFEIEEKKIFEQGLFLNSDHPAHYVATFNYQTDEAKGFSRVAYAALKGSRNLMEKFFNETSIHNLEWKTTALWSHRSTGFQERCPRKDQPNCPPASSKYRTADGRCNNLKHPWWGSAMSTMQRFLDPVYDDGIETIRKSRKSGKVLPSPREISTTIHEDKNVPLSSVTHMLMQWGQFIDHDMIATAQSRGFNGTFPQCCRKHGTEFQSPEFMHPDCLPIVVNSRDNFYGKLGIRCLEFVRSGPAPREDCGFGPREQLSQVTSFIDASMVYSSSVQHSNSLRIFRNGLLQYGEFDLSKSTLPKKKSDNLCQQGSLSTNCFRAGDARLSEQPALTSLHIVLIRLHNKLATGLNTLNPHWSDEKLFQESRKIVGALVQHITYREYLPIILGPEIIKIFGLDLKEIGYYGGYDPTLNPNIANSFATAAYRFGHSLVQHCFSRYDEKHNLIFNNISIHDESKNRVHLQSPRSVDRLVLGLINQVSQRRDEFITKELTNHLFQFPNFPFGMDLASINIQRGRDHGLAPYVKWREPCGLSAIRTWEDLEKSTSLKAARKLRNLYESLDDIDLFSGGLSEKPVLGGIVGPTFACIIAQQFNHLRRGDRFWYENGNLKNSFTLTQLDQIRSVTLAQILCYTIDDVKTVQPFVFLVPDKLNNERISCDKFNHINLKPWIEIGKNNRQFLFSLNNINKDDYFRNLKNESRMFPRQKPKPVKANVNQKNHVVMRWPFGSSFENVTIVIQNHASNSPTVVNNVVHESNVDGILTNPSSNSPTKENDGIENDHLHLVNKHLLSKFINFNNSNHNFASTSFIEDFYTHELPKPIKLRNKDI